MVNSEWKEIVDRLSDNQMSDMLQLVVEIGITQAMKLP